MRFVWWEPRPMWMFAGENREALAWPQSEGVEAMGWVWDGRVVPVLTVEQVGLAVELGREVLGYQVHLGALALGHQD